MKRLIAYCLTGIFGISILAQDPIVQTNYTADPAPIVLNDTIFLYTSHDEDDAIGFLMKNWLLYTSTDMVNWTDHGPVAGLENFKWFHRDNGAWAQQVVTRNGKYYMYCPLHGNGIGVLVADSPYGHFVDPLDRPLVWQTEHWDDIDPTVWIDDDGQAYMYWGNPDLYMVRLNEDMISYSGNIVKYPKIENYQEGPWFYKRGEKYYIAFASTCCPEGIGYTMSDSPTGPWTFTGYIMPSTERTRGNHPGIIDYKGKTYVFGQNSDLLKIDTPIYMERRSISAAEMHYNPDGTIQEVPYWKDNVLEQIEPFNPYQRIEGETMAWGYGLRTEKDKSGARYLIDVDEDETLMIKGVDFGSQGPNAWKARIRPQQRGASIELRIDDANGPLIGILPLGEGKEWEVLECDIEDVTGIHDLYLCFVGDGCNILNLDWHEFIK